MNAAVLYLVDASPYVFRAYHSLPATLRTRDGRPANAAYGFAGFLSLLLRREDLTHVAIAFDESLTTSFRNDFYPAYKAQRALPPPELVEQLADCRRLAEGFGVRTFASERYEADDLVGSLHRLLRDQVERVVLVTGDKDFAQLVDARTVLFDFAKDRWLDERGVEETLGVAPAQVVDLLALCGDAVDNIPGVAGVGPRSAVALLRSFASLDALYARLPEVAELKLRGARALAQKLAEQKDSALLSRRLATLETHLELSVSLADLEYRGAEEERLIPLLDELGFGRIRDRVPRFRDRSQGA